MLEGKNVRLRQIEEDDLEQFRDWRNSYSDRQHFREYKPLNLADQKKWFESLSSSNHVMFSIESKERVLMGCCGLMYIDWKNGQAELSIYIGEEKNKGKYESEVISLLANYGFKELRLHRIFSTIFSYNKEGIKLIKSLGFTLDGRHREARFWDGKYHDELIYSILDHERQL